MLRRSVSALPPALLLLLLAGCAFFPVPGATGAAGGTEGENVILPTSPSPTAPAPVSAPLPPGTPVDFGRWRWEVSGVAWDRTPVILAANAQAPKPPDGYGWAVVHLTAHNISAEEATPSFFDVVLQAGGWTVERRAMAASHVRLAEPFEPASVAPGGSMSGDVGFWMPLRAESDPTCVVHLAVRQTFPEPPTDFVFTCVS